LGTEWTKHQVELTRHWRRNVMEWLQRFVKGKDSVFGEVADYWFRFEEQGRGSLHLHLLLWLKKETVPGSADSQDDSSGDDDCSDSDEANERTAKLRKAFALARMPRGSHPFVQRLRNLVTR
ncbi:unnamed protein product, partial [Ascophyllum nodosum]